MFFHSSEFLVIENYWRSIYALQSIVGALFAIPFLFYHRRHHHPVLRSEKYIQKEQKQREYIKNYSIARNSENSIIALQFLLFFHTKRMILLTIIMIVIATTAGTAPRSLMKRSVSSFHLLNDVIWHGIELAEGNVNENGQFVKLMT